MPIRLLQTIALFCATCAAGFASSSVAAATLRYDIEVDADLTQVQVRAQFAQPVQALRARDAAGAGPRQLKSCESGTAALSYSGNRRLRLSRPVRCLSYVARMRSVARGGFVGRGAVLTSPRQWLWLPQLGTDDQVQVTLKLPPGVSASVPWARRAGGYVFGPSPNSGDAMALIGRFPSYEIPVQGGALRVALASSQASSKDSRIWQRWLQAAVRDVAAVGGRFPNPDAQIIVVPTSRTSSGSPVPFGHVVRDMGESVRFFVEPGRTLSDYLNDWTASHEFAHLLLPYVNDKWVSEGFASYYQNVLMRRRGAYSEAELWRRLNRSFSQAAAIPEPPTLAGLADEEFWRVRMLVYWSGAAVALLADAELRQRSGGTESLDTVLARLQQCCLPAQRSYSGDALFELLDELSPHPVFAGLYESFAHAPGMPTVDHLFAQLGIETRGSAVRLLDQGPWVDIRQAIEQGQVAASEVGSGED